MSKKLALLFSLILFSMILSACAAGSDAGAENAAEAYLNALVTADAEKMSTISCADWEMSAMLELDSFQAVEANLEDMACTVTGTDGDITLVNCEGKIVTSYNEELTEIPLNTRTYEVVNQGGEWLVCGYR